MKPKKTYSFLLPSAMILTIWPCITTTILAQDEQGEITELVEEESQETEANESDNEIIEATEEEDVIPVSTEQEEENDDPDFETEKDQINVVLPEDDNSDFVPSEDIEPFTIENEQPSIVQAVTQDLATQEDTIPDDIELPTVYFVVDGEIIDPSDSRLNGTHLTLTISNDRPHTIGVEVIHPLLTPTETGEWVEFYYVWFATADNGTTYQQLDPVDPYTSLSTISVEGPEAERTYSRNYSTNTFNYGQSYYHLEITGSYFKDENDWYGEKFYASDDERIFESNSHTHGHWTFSPTPIHQNSYTVDLITSDPASEPVGSISDYQVVYGYNGLTMRFTNEKELDDHTYSYQWYRAPQNTSASDQPVGEKIEGATSTTLSIEDGKEAGNYLYYIEVTARKNDNRDTKVKNFYSMLTVDQAPSKLQLSRADLDKAYDGTPVGEVAKEINGNKNKIQYVWYDEDGTKLDSAPINAGSYKVVASVEEDPNFLKHSVELPFTISKVQSLVQFTQNSLDKTYDGNCVVEYGEEIKGNSNDVVHTWFVKDGNDWIEIEQAPINAGSYKVVASVKEDPNFLSHSVELPFTISKVQSLVQFTQDSLDKTYDGNGVIECGKEKMGNSNDVVHTWFVKDGNDWIEIEQAPINAGSYKVVASVEEDPNFLSHSAEALFTISKVQSLVQFTQDSLDKTYDGNGVIECGKEKMGNSNDVVHTWFVKDGNDWIEIEQAPVDAGMYKVIARVEEDSNFQKDEKEMLFEIKKAIPEKDPQSDLFILQGKPISLLTLPEGFSWSDGSQIASELGVHPFKAIYTPADTKNYHTVEVEILVHVLPAEKAENQVPTIQAKDLFLTLGQEFNNDIALQGVRASDKEDGDLSSMIEIIQNTVDPLKAGTYTITYKVTDKDGASTTKTITVIIKALEEKPTNPIQEDKNLSTNEPSKLNKVDTAVSHPTTSKNKTEKTETIHSSSVLEESHSVSKKESPHTAVGSMPSIPAFVWSLASLPLLKTIKTFLKRKRNI